MRSLGDKAKNKQTQRVMLCPTAVVYIIRQGCFVSLRTWTGSCLIGSCATESLDAWADLAIMEPARTLKPLCAMTLPSLAAVLPDAFPAFIIMMLCCWTAAAAVGVLS